jgi:hypothetical protein
MPRALLSVSDKSGLIPFARGLADRGFELVSTGGTAKALESAGLPVVAISDVTGFPEMMDGRVKTLHPKVHGGILARREHVADLDAAAAHGITLIDLVVVNLYPFVTAAANPATPFDALVEEIDIGGPSMVRAAAKNFAGVLVVVSPADYDTVRTDHRASSGSSWLAKRSRIPARTTRRLPPSSTQSRITTRSLYAARRRDIRRRSRSDCASAVISATGRTRISTRPGMPKNHRSVLAPHNACKARSFRIRTCSISTPRCASFSSSASPRRRSSSTPIHAARRSDLAPATPMSAPAKRIHCRHSAPSSV